MKHNYKNFNIKKEKLIPIDSLLKKRYSNQIRDIIQPSYLLEVRVILLLHQLFLTYSQKLYLFGWCRLGKTWKTKKF